MSEATSTTKQGAPAPRLHAHYRDQIVKQLMQQFGYKTVMQVPRISKITLNMGVGEAVNDKKIMDNAVADMQKIAGQKPVVTKSRTSIATFKIRTGYPVGCMVTLRGTAQELVLRSYGRRAVHLEVEGDPSAVAAFESATIAI